MNIALADLDPQFVRYVRRGPTVYHEKVDHIALAQGVRFLCPKCFEANGGPVGTHVVVCWSRSKGIADDVQPGPGRWKMEGTGFADLTLNAEPPGGLPSIQLTGGCAWHGFITAGRATDTG